MCRPAGLEGFLRSPVAPVHSHAAFRIGSQHWSSCEQEVRLGNEYLVDKFLSVRTYLTYIHAGDCIVIFISHNHLHGSQTLVSTDIRLDLDCQLIAFGRRAEPIILFHHYRPLKFRVGCYCDCLCVTFIICRHILCAEDYIGLSVLTHYQPVRVG